MVLFPGGKKIRSKIIIDIGYLFKIDYKTLIIVGAAVECIHAYSLIHDDLPCMDNDDLRRGKPSHILNLEKQQQYLLVIPYLQWLLKF